MQIAYVFISTTEFILNIHLAIRFIPILHQDIYLSV